MQTGGGLALLLNLAGYDGANGYAALGLCNFTANPRMQQHLLDSGAVPVLIGLAKATTEATKQSCCKAIWNLSALEGSEQVITAGAASGLVMVALFRSDSPETKGQGAVDAVAVVEEAV